MKAVELCDQWGLDNPADLSVEVVAADPDIAKFLADKVGTLRRTTFAPGIQLYQSTRVEFVEAAPANFSHIVESWHKLAHLAPPLEKVKRTSPSFERHLFVVAVREALPVRLFTDDSAAPTTPPQGFESLDALWV